MTMVHDNASDQPDPQVYTINEIHHKANINLTFEFFKSFRILTPSRRAQSHQAALVLLQKIPNLDFGTASHHLVGQA